MSSLFFVLIILTSSKCINTNVHIFRKNINMETRIIETFIGGILSRNSKAYEIRAHFLNIINGRIYQHNANRTDNLNLEEQLYKDDVENDK